VNGPTERGRLPGFQRPVHAEAALSLAAYAKVNLSLEILGRRPDGFHEIVSVTQLISLADRVDVRPAATLAVDMVPPLVDPAENLATRAAEALAIATGHTPTARVTVRKQVPLAAGLGGGSSDAAATLRLLDHFWGTRLGASQLARIAAALGSDVPLFLGGATSLVRGRGEIVEALRPAPPFWLLLVCPGGAPAEKTRALYGSLTPEEYGDGTSAGALAAWLASGRSVVDATLVNSFDVAATRVYPGFAALRSRLGQAIGRPVQLTGAGPTLFATFQHGAEARQAARRVAGFGLPTIVARSIRRRPSVRHCVAPASPLDRSSE
jgi:4-diphosphocytidyl-2-C-methyl-D-erythritol kinase